MKLVGITGGIGSGKSLVARIFTCLNVPVYYADDRAKWLSDNDPEIKKEVIGLLGPAAYNPGGMNRAWVASQVFGQKEKLDALNAIIHPAVGKDFSDWAARQEAPYVLKEAALLFESGSYRQLNAVINISAPVELRIERTLKRDSQRSRKEVSDIITKQLTDEERRKRSDYEIVNDNETLVIPQVLSIHADLLQAAG